MKKFIVILSSLLLVFGVGCAALSSYVTPASVDQKALKYAIEQGTADVNEFTGYANLEKAEKLQTCVDDAHEVVQFKLVQQIDWDNLTYSQYKNVLSTNVTVGKQREEMLFGPSGLLSMGAGLLGVGGLGGIIGLMRKRPQDVTPEELEKAVAEVKGVSESELAEKNQQLIEIVASVKKFMDTFGNPTDPTLVKLKECMSSVQNTSTEVAVAQIKKQLVL